MINNVPNSALHIVVPATITQNIFAKSFSGHSRPTTEVTSPRVPCHILTPTARLRSPYELPGKIVSADLSATTPSSPSVSTVPIASADATLAPAITTNTLRKRRRTNSLFEKVSFRFAISNRWKRLKLQSPSSRKASTSSETTNTSSRSISPTTNTLPSPEVKPRFKPQTKAVGNGDECSPYESPISNLISTQESDLGSGFYNIVPAPLVELKPHPGTLVEFSSITDPRRGTRVVLSSRPDSLSSTSSRPCSTSSSEYRRSAAQDYHRYLRDARSTKTKVIPKTASSENSSRQHFYDSEYGSRARATIYTSSTEKFLENIDYKEQKAERRAQSLEAKAQLLREGFCTNSSLDYTRHNSQPKKGSTPSRRSSEDSAVLVLDHIRRSFEARKNSSTRESSYNIFKDEVEKGFLDGPL